MVWHDFIIKSAIMVYDTGCYIYCVLFKTTVKIDNIGFQT